MSQRMMAFLAVVAVALAAAGSWVVMRAQARGYGGNTATGSLTYVGVEPGLRVTFRYPAKWMLRQDRGKMEPYRGVRLLGPRNQEDTYTAYLSLRALPMAADGGRFADLQTLVANYRVHLPQGAQVHSSEQVTLAGLSAVELTSSFTLPPMHQPGLKALPIPVKSVTVFFERHPYLYELTYSADAREYDRHTGVLAQAKQSFGFR